jgi:toxin ParE1/3/4
MILLYTDRSKEDIDLAFAWYEKQRKGLGYEFIDCVEASIKIILEYQKIFLSVIQISE